MANVKISALPAATVINPADLLPVVQGGVTKQVTPDLLPLSAATAAALAGKDASGAAAAAQATAIQRVNHTGTQSADTITDGTTNKAYTATERTKLAGIAAGATANRADTATDAAIAAATAALVNSAPGTLDTLGELATALTTDEGAAAALTTLVGTKAPLASPAFTGTPTISGTAVARTSDVSAAVAAQATSDAATYATGASVVVAASDSATVGARYRCTGTGDQATINAAIAALPANGGKVLLLAGTYNLTGSVVINRRSVVLSGEGLGFWNEYVGNMPTASAGEGLGMTKLKAATATFPLIKIDNTVLSGVSANARLNGIEITGLYLYGASKAATTSVGIFCNDDGRPTDMLRIHNVFTHNVYDGMIVAADSPEISRCSIQDIGHHGIVMPNYGTSNPGSTWTGIYPSIHDNVIADIGGDCVNIGSQILGAVVHNNVLARGQHGVYTEGASSLISENQFIDNGAEAAYVLGGWCQVINNQFQNQSHISIRLNGNVGGQVNGNNIQGSGQAIQAFSCGNVMINQNQIRTTYTDDNAINFYNCTAAMADRNQVWLTSGSSNHSAVGASVFTGSISGNIARGFGNPFTLPTSDGTTFLATGNLSFAA